MRRSTVSGGFVQLDLGVLFAKHQETLLRYLTRFSGDPEIAADAAQEAYLRLLESPPDNTNNVRAWLFTVATNVVRDGWKRDKTASRLDDAPGRTPVGDETPDPHVAAEWGERAEMARRMLAKLSERERTIVLMWLEGFKHREIADAIGTTTKTISPTIARALNKLAGDITRQKREDPR